ncbi:signal transduction histidine-protein kinase BaeS [Clostridium homopropionicum DSM 5847]|uniref:histidine kinase n=1 Tax=Clostridium homopropionicum DSM 5847 TaxID=1121318 RepID=A0A0L6ZEP6_9CLOT|nr:HAMP domain-containing sensor histidine kinase [Clostridium homopropionicum]KOA21450.1 signal transduction histidine-protein kinase BaeS [Clostridium homopropionicum DSM 5847]SFG09420.1 Signal transduction histidine kinase [Clostridium homopropionicum]
MQTIRRKISIFFILCSICAILLCTLFVNLTINNKFNEYMINTQNKRYERIISFLQETYKREGKWTENSGVELIHEAYMSNYCLTLLDNNKKVIWGMDPNDIRNNLHFKNMNVKEAGIYNSKTFEIKVGDKIAGYVDIGQYSSVLLTEDDVNFKISVIKSIIASGLVTLAIIIIISLYISKQLAAPIKDVANMSMNLSEGRFDTKSTIKSDIKELENLRKSINVLAEKLKNQDIIRRRLVSDISHEIRTPLNILQNNIEAMIDGVFPVTNERLNYLNEEVVRFGKLLNNLNLLKEFEEESIKLNFEKISLKDLIEDIYNDFYMAAENKGIDLILKLDNYSEYYITGDKDKLKQVFINLISNAIKFTEKGKNICISLKYERDKVIAEVKDNGIGIKEEDLPFIFERLYRGDKSRHETQGNGIGLTIVKNILQLHLANIEVVSKEGKGTSFKIYFNIYK